MNSRKENIWNSKPLRYSGELSYNDFVVERKNAVIVRFNTPINQGSGGNWAYKNLITKDIGSEIYVAYITMKPGGGHDYHAHSGDEIVFMLENKVQFAYRSKDDKDIVTELNPGDAVYVPAGTPHSFWNIYDKPCNFLVIKHPPYFLEEIPLPREIREIKLYKGK